MVVEGWQKKNCILYSVSQNYVKHFLTNKLRLFLFYMLKNSYLCIVNRKIENGAMASENFVSGLRDFTACPERKNSVRKATLRVSQP